MNNKSRTPIIISIILLAIITGYLVFSQLNQDRNQKVNSYETCVAAGNPIVETWPQQCRDPLTGQNYVENIYSAPQTLSYESQKAVKIRIDDWTENRQLSSPFTVNGLVPGSWSFEASFPIDVMSSSNKLIATVPATLQGEWMTTKLVPFSAEITYDASYIGQSGKIILHKSNPSGLPDNDDSLELKVKF